MTDKSKAGTGWVQHSWWEMPVTSLHLKVHLFIQHVWESRVKCRLSSYGSIRVSDRNREAVVCYLVQTILTRSACPVFLARQPCWTLPPLGGIHAYQPKGPWHSHCLSLPQLTSFGCLQRLCPIFTCVIPGWRAQLQASSRYALVVQGQKHAKWPRQIRKLKVASSDDILSRELTSYLAHWKRFILIFILFIRAYNVWVIFPPPPPLNPPLPPLPPFPTPTPLTPHYQAETILPLSLILL
jgi:hypothetical protein